MKSKELLQAALDYLHKNITASIVYECDHDYSAGVKGAEVDYFPETADELLQEIGNEYADQFSEGDGWVKVEEDILPPMDEKTQIICADGEQYIGFYTGADNRGGDHWFCDNNDYHYPTHWRRLPQPPKQ